MPLVRFFNIRNKLIITSTILIFLIIGLFSMMNSREYRTLVDDSSNKLQENIIEGLRQSGLSELQLLTETSKVILSQNDYGTLQTIVETVFKKDRRLVEVAVIDWKGMVLAHSVQKNVGKKAAPHLLRSLTYKKISVLNEIEIARQRSMIVIAPLTINQEQQFRVVLAYGLKALTDKLNSTKKLQKQVIATSLKRATLLGVFFLLVGLLLSIFQGYSISKPIKELAVQAKRIARGDFMARTHIRSRDEIGALGKQFNFMASQVVSLMKKYEEKARLEKELEVATAIQSAIIPPQDVLDLNGLKLAGYFSPATQCGGDWWSYFSLTDGKVLVMIGDVTGHGIGSAMITAAAQGAAASIMSMSNGTPDLSKILKVMNKAICKTADGNFVMTCYATIFDPKNETLTIANAGHNFPFIYDAQTGEIEELVVRGNRLGDVPQSEYYTRKLHVKSHDTLIWYTDGIIECENPMGEEYGLRRFRNLLKKLGHLPPEIARDEIIRNAQSFYGEAEPKDDITLVCGKIGIGI